MRIYFLCLLSAAFAACSTSPRIRYTDAMFGPVPAATEEGVASWYHANWFGIGEMTASGERFHQYEMTAAHKHLPLGTFVRVVNLHNGRSTIARITDRGPYINGRIIDLSKTGAKDLGFHQVGGWAPPLPPIAVGEAVLISSPCCSNAPPDMQLWFPFDEPTGTTSYNFVAGGLNGEQVVGTTVNNGYVFRSLCFDGNSQYVYVPYYPGIDITTGDLSIDAWVKRAPGDDGVRQIVYHRSWSPTRQGYALSLNDGVLTFTMRSGGTLLSVPGQTVPPDGNWHFVAVTAARVPGGGQLYMDNTTPIGFTPIAGSYANGSPLLVGAASISPVPSLEFFKGCIDEVEVFNRALTSPEVTTIFSSGSAGKCKPPCTNAPVIFGCSDITTNCADNNGQVVSYVLPTATGFCCPGEVMVYCSPASGTRFPIGVSTVTCIAIDGCGNTNTCTFNVNVIGHGSEKWTWAREAGSPGADHGNAVAVDRSGNVFVTGSYATNIMMFPPFTETLAGFGANDGFLAKYNAAGVLQWVARFGGNGPDSGNGVAVDVAGNVYVTGGFMDTAAFKNYNDSTAVTLYSTSVGFSDVFVAKYDPSGFCQWAQNYGAGFNDFGSGIAVTPAGNNVFVTGYWSVSGSQSESFLLKVNGANGVQVNNIISSGASGQSARGRAIALDPSGDVFVTGAYGGGTTAFGACSLPANAMNPCMYVAKFIGGVGCQWVANGGNTGATGYSDGTGIAVDPTGTHCYATASFTGTANFGAGISVTDTKNIPSGWGQLNDYLIVNLLASAGTPVWAVKGTGAASGGAASDDEMQALAVDPEGNPCITGFMHPNAPYQYVNEGPTVLVACYEGLSGVLRWTRNAIDVAPDNAFAGSPSGVGHGIAVDQAGCAHVTGDFNEQLQFPPIGLPVASLVTSPVNLRDVFLAKMCPLCDCLSGLIVTQPINQHTAFGASTTTPVVFTATAGGSGPFTYQWLRNGTPIANGGCYSGVHLPTLTLTCDPTYTLSNPFDTGVYSVVVTNGCDGSITPSAGAHIIYDPQICCPEVYQGGFHFQILTPVPIDPTNSINYTVEFKNNLYPSTPWLVLTNITVTSSNTPIVDPTPNSTERYYRVRLLEGP